jgi:hypothetical protein
VELEKAVTVLSACLIDALREGGSARGRWGRAHCQHRGRPEFEGLLQISLDSSERSNGVQLQDVLQVDVCLNPQDGDHFSQRS